MDSITHPNITHSTVRRQVEARRVHDLPHTVHTQARNLYALQQARGVPDILPTAFLPWDALARGWGRAT